MDISQYYQIFNVQIVIWSYRSTAV